MKDVDLLVAGTDHRLKDIQKHRLVNSLMRLTRQDMDQKGDGGRRSWKECGFVPPSQPVR